ncbi:gliding motility-associated C-terminal domain-containing protein [Mucilaginibacter sp.]|uniref:gliding motility-associated C-terminal domain-containing protein n=1 Tax=Mucilaginibacter sp. TaxID=1882438 RepID=UPI0025F85C62|nr:gliding motility-associated C-terminal domain-containing protein [Mucilaginibacter sp.]
MRLRSLFNTLFLFLISTNVFGQQDVELHINAHFLPNKKILKVKRDFNDPYVWVLAENNEVYRVNSTDNTIDDFSNRFTDYHNYLFTDIAGLSGDVAYIAVNSNAVIEYKNERLKIISESYGLLDKVNTIGIDYTKRFLTETADVLLIGTTKGLYRYNIDSDKLILSSDPNDSQVYEANYRKLMFSGTYYIHNVGFDTVNYQPTELIGDRYIFPYFVWQNEKTFGTKINTAYYATSMIYDFHDHANYVNMFWGNDRGMFQINGNESFSATWPHKHYLSGIEVNKITGVYGLAAFGNGHAFFDPGIIKETLLVGTNTGLYFSSSIYDYYGNNDQLNNFSLFYFKDLGQVKVNDISVNTKSIVEPVCEDGIWLATDEGLYLVKTDYSKFLNAQTAKLVTFKDEFPDVATKKICAGEKADLIADSYSTGNAAVQWYKNDMELVGQSKTTLEVDKPGEYYAVLYDPCQNIHFESNHLIVEVISAPIIAFDYPEKKEYCDSAAVTLQTENSTAYHYRWFRDSTQLSDTTYRLVVSQNGRYRVEVSACAGSWVSSKQTEVELINLPEPSISPNRVTYCQGDIARLSANISPDSTFDFSWYCNGEQVPGTLNQIAIDVSIKGDYVIKLAAKSRYCLRFSSTYHLSFVQAPLAVFNYPDTLKLCNQSNTILKTVFTPGYHYRWYKNMVLTGVANEEFNVQENGNYQFEVSTCEGSWLLSKAVYVEFNKTPLPTIIKDKPVYCVGDVATLNAGITRSTNYHVIWTIDDEPATEWNDHVVIKTTKPGNYKVRVVNSQQGNCLEISNDVEVKFVPRPEITLHTDSNKTLCEGQSLELMAMHTKGEIKWFNGASSDKITVNRSGIYNVSITSASGCTADTSLTVYFNPKPIINLSDTTICMAIHEEILLTAPKGLASYSWNGIPGTNIFRTNHPQIINLTVTDNHGCEASKQILVSELCGESKIPNTFTPNGDGVNDTWAIPSLQDDPKVLVRVFNRYGTLVYRSKGYSNFWNGLSGGKRLPNAVYYYLISRGAGKPLLSGFVAILY